MAKTFRRKSIRKMKSKRNTIANRKIMKGKGASQSSIQEEEQKKQWAKEAEHAQAIALQNYHMRVNSWRGPRFGPEYHNYMNWCNAQYQLESIPEAWRRGSNTANDFDEQLREHQYFDSP